MTAPTPCRNEYEFAIVLAGPTDLDDDLMDALAGAGCDDATPSLRYGRVALTFTRVAPDYREAVVSAIRDIRASGMADVYALDECTLVSQADIARRIGKSRQLVGQYISGRCGAGAFPGPVCGITDGHSLWQWCEVSHWLWQNHVISKEKLDESTINALVNAGLEWSRMRRDPLLTEEIAELAAEAAAMED